MADEGVKTLQIDEEFSPIIYAEECEELKPVLKTFVESYVQHKDEMTVEEWLPMEMAKNLPETNKNEIEEISKEIILSVRATEEKQSSLENAVSQGRSKESWFASEMKQATSTMSSRETAKYLQQMDDALLQANDSLYRTITTQAGNVSQNPNLDGFIAEQYHAQTFNMNADAKGSKYRAKVLEPDGKGYAKNSVDLVIVDETGKTVRRYQSKYCKDADATAAAFAHGDYRGQRKLVPEGQENGIAGAIDVIEAPDGVKSNPLSKKTAEQMRDEAQSGNWNELNWNEYQTKDLAIGIGKQAGYAALQGAAIGIGFDIAGKLWNGEVIDGEEIVETAIKTGSDFGIKAAAAGALKVGVEKEIVTVIPKGTPAGTIANISYVAVENVKVIGKMMEGEYTFKEGMEKMEQTTVATVAGLAGGAKGTAVGAAIGAVFGPVGAAVGGFIGGTVGYMGGSKIGETVVKGVQKVRDAAREVIRTVKDTVVSVVQNTWEGIKSFASGLFGWW